MERERWVLWLPVLFGIGISIYFALKTEPPLWLGIAVAASAGLILYRLKRDDGGVTASLLVAIAVIAAGFGVAQWRTITVDAPILTDRIGPTTVTGRVIKTETFPSGSRVTVDRARVSNLSPDRVPEKIRLRLRGKQPGIKAGAWLQIRAMVSPPPPPSAPGAFDFQRQSYFHQLGGVGFSLGRADIIAGPADHGLAAFIGGPARLRQTIREKISAVLTGTAGTIAVALMTGERSAIPKKVMSAIRDPASPICWQYPACTLAWWRGSFFSPRAR